MRFRHCTLLRWYVDTFKRAKRLFIFHTFICLSFFPISWRFFVLEWKNTALVIWGVPIRHILGTVLYLRVNNQYFISALYIPITYNSFKCVIHRKQARVNFLSISIDDIYTLGGPNWTFICHIPKFDLVTTQQIFSIFKIYFFYHM